MMRSLSRWIVVAFVSSVIFPVLRMGTVENAAAQPPPAPAATQPPPQPAAAQPSPESAEAEEPEPMFDYPLVVQGEGSEIVVYQPQLESFKNNKITARAAISVKKTGQEEPVFGAMWIEGRADTDRESRTVKISDIQIPRVRFPGSEDADEKALSDTIEKAAAGKTATLSLDQLLAQLAVVEKATASVAKLDSKPPKIVYRDHTAVLIQFDGQPRMSKASDGKLLRAVNTPYFVVLDPDAKTYYLKGGGTWYTAPEALGPYKKIDKAPDAVEKEAQATGYVDPEEKKAAEKPADKPAEQTAEQGADEEEEDVEIVTATEPTELVWTDGPAEATPITGTNLLYAANTESDVFLDIDNQDIYVLLSGRWYTGKSREGPWTFVPSDKLPADFQKIPPESEKGDVLASVAGTEAAQEALLDNSIPQTAAIDRKNIQQPKVEYDGPPQFKPIEGTTLSYAVNTPNSVIQVGSKYYCCFDAVWYVANDPNGPWEVCTSVPPEVYGIPPSSPVYPVTYVYVYDSTPDTVYCGYTPGYVGSYPYYGSVVYGTGYYYPGWWGNYYYPYPYTYGYGAHYNSYTGNWGYTVGARGPNGWLVYHQGAYGSAIAGGRWGGGWWGSSGYRDRRVDPGYGVAAPRADLRADQRNANVDRARALQGNNNLYNRRNDVRRDVGQRPLAGTGARAQALPAAREARQPGTVSTRDLSAQTRSSRPSNDVFADRDGNVYRRNLDGWQQRDQGKWVSPDRAPSAATRPAQRPSAPSVAPRPAQRPSTPNYQQQRQQLNRDYRARTAGQSRASNYQRQASRPSYSRQASRPSGGSRSAARPSGGARGGARGGRR